MNPILDIGQLEFYGTQNILSPLPHIVFVFELQFVIFVVSPTPIFLFAHNTNAIIIIDFFYVFHMNHHSKN